MLAAAAELRALMGVPAVQLGVDVDVVRILTAEFARPAEPDEAPLLQLQSVPNELSVTSDDSNRRRPDHRRRDRPYAGYVPASSCRRHPPDPRVCCPSRLIRPKRNISWMQILPLRLPCACNRSGPPPTPTHPPRRVASFPAAR